MANASSFDVIANFVAGEPPESARWLPIGEAEYRLQSTSGEYLLKLLKDGVVRARFLRGSAKAAFVGEGLVDPHFEAHQSLMASHRTSTSPLEGSLIAHNFWHAFKSEANQVWQYSSSFPWAEFHYADWKKGQFGALTYAANLPSFDLQQDSDEIVILMFYGVQVCADDIESVCPTTIRVSPTLTTGRSTKYPWDQAIAAFAGHQHKFDLVPDLYAPGAQAVIEKFIASWLSERDLNASESAVRDKAKLVLRAYKEADSSEG